MCSGGSKSKLVVEGTWRLDRQDPPTGGGANLQVQINGMKGASSLATLVIGPDVLHVNSKPPGKKSTQLNTIIKTLKGAFVKSLETGTTKGDRHASRKSKSTRRK